MVRWTLPGLVVSVCVGALLAASAAAGPTGDRAVAEAAITELGAPAASASAALVKRPVSEAKRALERALGARQAGDVARAEMLEGLAREWAETARDIVRAAATEADSGAIEQEVVQSAVQAERARTLLEESIAHRGEAQAQLAGLEAASAEPIRSAAPPKAAGSKKPAKNKPKSAPAKTEPVQEAP